MKMRRFWAIVTAIVMTISLLPTASFAAGDSADANADTRLLAGNIVSVKKPELKDVSVIEGDDPMLPKTLTATLDDGSTASVGVTWKGSAPVDGKATYTGTIEGYSESIEVEAEVLPCDNEVETFYNAGNSDGANFDWNNKLGYTYGGGTVVFDTTITVPAGSNKLISYGNETTGAFSGTGPIIRFAQPTYFEYYDGAAKVWKQSAVASTAGKTYRIRTIANVTDKTYRVYVTDEDGVKNEVTNGDTTFRNPDLSTITLMTYHGAGYTAGEDAAHSGGITSHRVSWKDGWSPLTVNYISAEGDALDTPLNTKWATGTTYTENARQYIVKDNKVYVRKDTQTAPSIKVTEDNHVLNVTYDEVDASVGEVSDANTVVGQEPIMPSKVSIKFDNGQSVLFDVTWDISEVDVTQPGVYQATGHVTGLGIDVECNVNVKAVTIDDSQLGKVSVATNNGGWNWYVEPSGTHIQPGDKLASRYEGKTTDINGEPIIYKSNNNYVFSHDCTYMGWVEDNGDIVVAQYDHDEDEYTRVVIHEKLESDDHNNPAVVILPDGRIMAIYSMHTNEPYMYFRVTKRPEDITEWNDEQFYHGTGANATYPSVFMVHDDPDFPNEDVIYIGWRGVHWMPTLAKFSIPDENGEFPAKYDSSGKFDGIKPLMEQTQFANTTFGYSTWNGNSDAPNAYTDGGASDNGRRPYTKYDYDFDRNRIYITFTASHPDNDIRNHIYYLYLDIDDQNLYTAMDRLLQPLPKENSSAYVNRGAEGTSGQWGVVTTKLVDAYPELIVFNASDQTGEEFNPKNAKVERRGWTWDIVHNDKGEPCIVYADITATPPDENGLPPQAGELYLANNGDTHRRHHYYWYARWDSESKQWVNTFLTYAGKWFHQNATQERCYSGGLTFDHNFPGNVIYLSVPTEGEYGNVHEIYRWVSDDYGATWTTRQAITKDSPTPNARPNTIYNYKMNEETGENEGPRLLWISGEYRYWMNYEYKTGVKTDFADMITQDDPEMFADARLTVGGEEIEKLPVGDETITAEFKLSNISIGDGKVKLALAHYDGEGILKGFVTKDCDVPARSVPQTGIVGADVDEKRGNKLSAMGEPEVGDAIEYLPENGFEEGDSVKLFAWGIGIEQPMAPLFGIPFEMSTDGSRYIISEDFSYDGNDKLVLTEPFNGWDAKIYNTSESRPINEGDGAYSAITKAPFGNTALHIYHVNNNDGEGLMVSHEIPDTDGKDYTLEFTMRHIDEMSWRNTDNQGFTLSHGVPEKKGDTANPSAFQYRFKSNSNDENGRGTYGMLRHTTAFDSGSETEVFHNVPLNRDVSDTYRYERSDYSKGEGYYDTEKGEYIHDYNDALYTGALFHIKVNVHPSSHIVDMSVSDGYRTAYCTSSYEGDLDWDKNPIDTITFSIGNERWGEVYIDDFRMYISDGTSALRNVYITPVNGTEMKIGSEWTILPLSDGSNVIFAPNGEVMEVSGQSTSVGGVVDTYPYDGGDNHKFYIDKVSNGYLLRGKQSGLYVRVFADGTTKLDTKANATVFSIEDAGVEASAAVMEIAGMIEDGTYEAIMDAIFPEE